jgi:hypothetical protein
VLATDSSVVLRSRLLTRAALPLSLRRFFTLFLAWCALSAPQLGPFVAPPSLTLCCFPLLLHTFVLGKDCHLCEPQQRLPHTFV